MITPDDIDTFAAGGESETTEFKETTGQRQAAARTLSAMLNGQGGRVLFGVRPNGGVVGQQVADKTLEDVTQVCREIHPRYPPSIERVTVPDGDGREVLVVSVPSGSAKPYAYKGNYFVRSGAATVDMPDEVQLSLVLERAHAFDRWELAPSAREVDAIDRAEVTAFRDDAIANNRAPFEAGAEVPEVLRSLGLVDDADGPNRAAIALFATGGALGGEYSMLGCHLVAVDGTDLGEDLLDESLVERNAFAALRAAFDFCRKHLTQPVHLEGLQAEVGLEVPELVIREALANAFAHRDYATAGRVQVRVYTDRLEVVSPGGLHFGLTTTDLYVPHGSHPWNPLVIGALYRRGIVDQLGSGTLRMVRLCAAAGLGRPVFSATPAAVTCAIPRKGYWVSPDGSSTAITDVEASALRALADGPRQRGDLADEFGLPDTTTRDLLARLRDHGLVHPEGHGRGATWVLGPG
ncbi:MAG: putative DNA binding domain-containing protein [Acidimicrobiia bacterium]|nr:putative DNA binding domain-containing protein [Acidimicrobiia bacterium]